MNAERFRVEIQLCFRSRPVFHFSVQSSSKNVYKNKCLVNIVVTKKIILQFWGIILFIGKHQNLIDVFFGLVWPGVGRGGGMGWGVVRYTCTLKINYVLKSVNPIPYRYVT